MKKLIVLLGVIGVSLSAIFVRISTAPSIILVLYRVCIASLLLSPYVFIKSRKELFELSLRDVLLCMVSGVFLGLHFTAYSLHYPLLALPQQLFWWIQKYSLLLLGRFFC